MPTSRLQNPLSINAPVFKPAIDQTATVAMACLTAQDLAQILAASEKDLFPGWKLSQYNGDPLQWRELFGQFKIDIDYATLSDDVKLVYMKTLLTGKAKTTIEEFAYSGTMYQDALRTLFVQLLW